MCVELCKDPKNTGSPKLCWRLRGNTVVLTLHTTTVTAPLQHGLSYRHEEGPQTEQEGQTSLRQLRAGREEGDVDSSDEQDGQVLPGEDDNGDC